MNAQVQIDVRQIVFPMIAGNETPQGFNRSGFLGTGFFVGRRGLALTAAHVVSSMREGQELRVALPTPERTMRARGVRWGVELPGSDILVMRVDVETSACFASRFDRIPIGQDVETAAIPAAMLETDSAGATRILMRCAKGYVSHGQDRSIAASFPLLKGMSGGPLIATNPGEQFVAGVFVGQTRGEAIEDQIEEVIDEGGGAKRTHVERISRVEYFARGDLLAPHANFTAPEFEGRTLQELIAEDIRP
jgi:Trypsin-like peptidase domain